MCIRKSFKLDFKVANELKKMEWMGVQTCSQEGLNKETFALSERIF